MKKETPVSEAGTPGGKVGVPGETERRKNLSALSAAAKLVRQSPVGKAIQAERAARLAAAGTGSKPGTP